MKIFKNIKINETLLAGLIVSALVIGGNILISRLLVSSDESKQFSIWDAESASFKRYESYEEMENELENDRKSEQEEYYNATRGTIVEQIQNISIPKFSTGNVFVQLHQGEVQIRESESDELSNGFFAFGAYLDKSVGSFVVSDFNNDGLEDVAHVIGYTGGGSGFFYNLTVFINQDGKLKYLSHEELGDRVVVRSVQFDSGIFIIDLIIQGEGDDFMGFCCPNVKKILRLKLEGDKLLEI